MKDLLTSQKPKSVLGKVLRIVVSELINIVLTWGLEKFRGVQPSAPGATGRPATKSRKRPGAQPSSP